MQKHFVVKNFALSSGSTFDQVVIQHCQNIIANLREFFFNLCLIGFDL
jgi:hypothetical protein